MSSRALASPVESLETLRAPADWSRSPAYSGSVIQETYGHGLRGRVGTHGDLSHPIEITTV